MSSADEQIRCFDAHLHIIDPQYPLVKNEGYLPPDFTVEQYLNRVKTLNLNIEGGAVVSGSFQAYDHDYLVDAFEQLGDSFVGVANIPAGITMRELDRLNKAGVVAARFNIVRGGSDQINNLIDTANRVHNNFGWHAELYIENTSIEHLRDILDSIPAYSIDHLGLTKEGLQDLYELVEKGVRVKASGFGRVNFNVVEVMQKIYSINPRALIFGTDLPSTRADTPFSGKDIELIKQNFSKKEQRMIFFENGYHWYMKK